MIRSIGHSLQLLAVFAGALIVTGCFGDGFSRLNVARTTGRVVCDGKPVSRARVYFEPLWSGEKGKPAGKQGLGLTDDEGRFSISTYSDNDGAVVGNHRVRVEALGGPCDCVTGSEIDAIKSVAVVSGKTNEIEVVLPKKPVTASGAPAQTGPKFGDDEFDKAEQEAWDAEMKAKKGG